jgi:cytosine permease
MGLIWLTMVTGSPTVLAGFAWHQAGFSFSQVILCTLISCTILLIYSVAANDLGARSGQTYAMLSCGAFGRFGSYLVRVNLLLIFLFWYGWIALFVADSMKGLFSINAPTALLAAFMAILMAQANFFGFSGVANVARYASAPILITWVFFTFLKVCGNTPHSVFFQPAHAEFSAALTTISAFTIGFAVWGNEPDYWRYSRPNKLFSGLAVMVSLLVGQVIFPITGWLLANLSGISESSAAFKYLNDYSLSGIPFLALLVLLSDNCAANDSNLFGLIATLRSLKQTAHRTAVVVLALCGAAVAASLSWIGVTKGLESVASLNCIIMPTPTAIMIAEWLISERRSGRPFFTKIVPFDQLPFARWPAILALIAGSAVGIATAGVIPGTESWHVGIAALQAWLTALLVYIPLRLCHKSLAKLFTCFKAES